MLNTCYCLCCDDYTCKWRGHSKKESLSTVLGKVLRTFLGRLLCSRWGLLTHGVDRVYLKECLEA